VAEASDRRRRYQCRRFKYIGIKKYNIGIYVFTTYIELYLFMYLLAELPVVAGFKYKKCLQPNFNRTAADQDRRLI